MMHSKEVSCWAINDGDMRSSVISVIEHGRSPLQARAESAKPSKTSGGACAQFPLKLRGPRPVDYAAAQGLDNHNAYGWAMLQVAR
jgi:hypothetical protein